MKKRLTSTRRAVDSGLRRIMRLDGRLSGNAGRSRRDRGVQEGNRVGCVGSGW